MDRKAIEDQYRSSANLAARIDLHLQCSTNPYGLQRWIFDRLALAPGHRVLEIACGTGSLWSENLDRIPRGLKLVLSDISPGMVETTRLALPERPSPGLRPPSPRSRGEGRGEGRSGSAAA